MKALTEKELRAKAPAIFAEGADLTRTSDRYQAMSTVQAMDFLQGEGYMPTDANQMFARKKDNNFTRHVVMMTHEDHMNAEAKGVDVIPRIMLFNSHNATTALKLQTGFFRFVCANGIIVGDTVQQVKLRHSASNIDILNEQLLHAAGIAKDAGDKIEKWKKRKLTAGAREAFALNAAALRTGGNGSLYTPGDVLAVTREADESNDLWTVFNRVQENLIKGGIQGIRGDQGRAVSLRPLTNIRKNTEFNQKLWNLADQAYRTKGAMRVAA